MPTHQDIKGEAIKTFDQLVAGLGEYAAKHNLPLSIVEGACRDMIAQVEARRLLGALRNQGAKL